jgi:hypothetical protein
VDEFVACVALSVVLSELFGVSVAVGVFVVAGAVTVTFGAAFAAGDEGASLAGASDVISRGSADVGLASCGFSFGACVLVAGSDAAAAASNISSTWLPRSLASGAAFPDLSSPAIRAGTSGAAP